MLGSFANRPELPCGIQGRLSALSRPQSPADPFAHRRAVTPGGLAEIIHLLVPQNHLKTRSINRGWRS